MSRVEVGRELLFAALAVHAKRVDEAALSAACASWLPRRETGLSLADVLVERGALDPASRAEVAALVEARLAEFDGRPRAALSALVSAELRRTLSSLGDDEIRRALDEVGRSAASLDRLHGTIERYSLDHVHAHGGLGRVWLARDLDLDRDVALKEIRPEHADDPERWIRLLAEAQLTGRLDHPGVVPIYEVARKADGRQPFYTMRFVRGRTLSAASRALREKRLRGENDGLEMQTLIVAFVAVCNTLAYAHSKGVIHRDLKGDNVILGDFGEVIVLDWGIAKALDDRTNTAPSTETNREFSGMTEEGDIVGTPAFMSPEQAEGRISEVDAQSDVYGLGAILYEVLTGQPPFVGEDTLEIIRRVRQSEPFAPRTLDARTPRELDAICRKALAKQKSARYATAGELAKDVQRFLADEPVSAYREPLTKRAARFARRHRVLVSGAAVLLVSAVIALSIGLNLLAGKQRQIEQARARAEANFGLARESVDKYLTRVAANPELQAHALEPLRRQLLETAREFYQTFLSERSNDVGLNRDLASALVNLGLIERQLLEIDKAESSYAKALDVYAKLLESDRWSSSALNDFLLASNDFGLLYAETSRPEKAEPLYRHALDTAASAGTAANDERCLSQIANLRDNLATMYIGVGRRSEAEVEHLAGLEIRRRLAKDFPKNEEHRNSLVMSLNNLVVLYGTTGRAQMAEPLVREAAAIIEMVVEDHPGMPEYENELAATYNNLGGVYTLLGREDDARRTHERALGLREKLVREHPAVLDYAVSLAGTYCNLGELACRRREPANGLEWLAKSVDVLHGVLEREPKHAEALYFSSYTESWIARADDALGRRTEALQHWSRAIELDTRGDPALRIGESTTLARSGERARALELADASSTATGIAGETYYALAATYALCAGLAPTEADDLAARSLRALGEAARADYFATRASIDRLTADPDFAALVLRDDFGRFVEGLKPSK